MKNHILKAKLKTTIRRLEKLLAEIEKSVQPPTTSGRAKARRADGYFSVSDVARSVGVARPSVEYAIKKQRIAAPTRTLPSGAAGLYYSAADVRRIEKVFAERRGWKRFDAKRGKRQAKPKNGPTGTRKQGNAHGGK